MSKFVINPNTTKGVIIIAAVTASAFTVVTDVVAERVVSPVWKKLRTKKNSQ